MKKININQDYSIKDIKLLSEKEMTDIFKILGDNIRYKISKKIFHNPGIIGKEILADFNISQPSLSFHINQLKKANLIIEVKDGQTHKYFTNYKQIISFNISLMHEYGSFAHKIDELYRKEKEFFDK